MSICSIQSLAFRSLTLSGEISWSASWSSFNKLDWFVGHLLHNIHSCWSHKSPKEMRFSDCAGHFTRDRNPAGCSFYSSHMFWISCPPDGSRVIAFLVPDHWYISCVNHPLCNHQSTPNYYIYLPCLKDGVKHFCSNFLFVLCHTNVPVFNPNTWNKDLSGNKTFLQSSSV